MKNVYFKSIIEAKGIAYEMRSSDFIDIPNGMSNGKYTSDIPYLKDVRIVQFREGSTNLFWKESYEERGYKEAPFLKKKVVLQIENCSSSIPFHVKPKQSFVTTSQKQGIVNNLCKYIHSIRHAFWRDLPVADHMSDDEN